MADREEINFEIGRSLISNRKFQDLKLDSPSARSNSKFRNFGFEIGLRTISKFPHLFVILKSPLRLSWFQLPASVSLPSF
ncbi:MAG: hypothetical protein DMG15_27850, partial [Acidobacteria bacterium]